MKLLVIGHSVLDFINDGKLIKQSAGGIHYTVKALNKLKSAEDDIFLCSQYDDETISFFNNEIDKIDKSFLTKVDRIPRVHLNIFKEKERHEKYENITNNLTININDFNQFDGILINMITGYDINLNQLKHIRNNYNGLVFIDVHTLSRGLDENYKRNFRVIPNFNEWAKRLNIIQVNQQELFTLFDLTSEDEIVNKIFTYGIRVLCVTKGEFGATVYFHKNDKVISNTITGNKANNPNVVGCGDIFGATFFYNYIRNKNVIDSLNVAVTTAESFVRNEFV